jgi:drug/metabolite transporter (DMT)-like permease
LARRLRHFCSLNKRRLLDNRDTRLRRQTRPSLASAGRTVQEIAGWLNRFMAAESLGSHDDHARAVSNAALRQRMSAIALMCAATIFFACLDTSAKSLSGILPAVEIVWARYVAAAIVGLVAVRPISHPEVFRSSRPLLQIVRSLLLLASTTTNFLALRQLQLAETSTINFLTPLFVVLMAGPLLGEWAGGARLIAVAIGFIGVVVATGPGTSAFHPVVLIAIAGVVCNAGYALTTRLLARFDSSRTTLTWTPIAGVVLLTPALPFLWVNPPTWSALAIMVGMGFFASLGHWLLILAHERAPASVLTPFGYTQLLWMIIAGLVVFGDRPSPAVLAGASIVVGCGLYLIWREQASKRR